MGQGASRFESLKLVLLFELEEVDRIVVLPEIGDGVYPGGVHGADVLSLAGDVAVFGRVIVTDDEVGYVGGEVVLVHAA